MEKLKTLKDFEVNPKSWAGVPELKQEAIKHIKEDQKQAEFAREQGDDELLNFNLGRKSFAKEFFNITEEDLKIK